jgi:hypothetical protein
MMELQLNQSSKATDNNKKQDFNKMEKSCGCSNAELVKLSNCCKEEGNRQKQKCQQPAQQQKSKHNVHKCQHHIPPIFSALSP